MHILNKPLILKNRLLYTLTIYISMLLLYEKDLFDAYQLLPKFSVQSNNLNHTLVVEMIGMAYQLKDCFLQQ